MRKNTFKTMMNITMVNETQLLRELSVDEQNALKACLLDMFQDVYSVCQKHRITIMMTGGSTLGSIRHGGFIPWDDDLDLTMPRKDYERLKAVFEEELGDKYILCAPNYSDRAKSRFPKIMKKGTSLKELSDINSDLPCGVFLDVFILENIPQNKILRRLKGLYCNVLMLGSTRAYWYERHCLEIRQYMCATSVGKKMYYSQMAQGWFFSHIAPSWKWFNAVDRAVRHCKETGMLGIPTGRKHYFGEILPKYAYLPVSFGMFENIQVPLPADCDMVLKNLYGDYMQIPSPEKRERHLVVSMDLNRS